MDIYFDKTSFETIFTKIDSKFDENGDKNIIVSNNYKRKSNTSKILENLLQNVKFLLLNINNSWKFEEAVEYVKEVPFKLDVTTFCQENTLSYVEETTSVKNITNNKDLKNSNINENKNFKIIDIYILKFTYEPKLNSSTFNSNSLKSNNPKSDNIIKQDNANEKKIAEQNTDVNKDEIIVVKKSFSKEEIITYLGVDLEFYLDLNQREKYCMKFILLFLLIAKSPNKITKNMFKSDCFSLWTITSDDNFVQNFTPNNSHDSDKDKANNVRSSMKKLKSRYCNSSISKSLQNGEYIHIFEQYMFHDKIYNLYLSTHIIPSLDHKFIICDLNIFSLDRKDHYKKLFCGFLPKSNLNFLEYFKKNFVWSNEKFMSNLKRNMINIIHNNNNEKIENIKEILV